MNQTIFALLLYLLPLTLIIFFFLYRQNRRHKNSLRLKEEAISDGLSEPPTLHPQIDTSKCIGCRSCVTACPEGKIIGIINQKAQLVSPSLCIGHGACAIACPVGAISLVFGTEKRGVDIPELSPNFESSVPGVYIAGELGGMGLIRNAIEQGRQAMDSISKVVDPSANKKNGLLDVLIVGAGPAGFSASLSAMHHHLNTLTIEQDTLGGTVSHYPRGKLVMTSPVDLPLHGKVKFTDTTKEELLDFWQNVEQEHNLSIGYQERLESVKALTNCTGFSIKTTVGEYQAATLLLAIGRRGTPRKLGVPGESLTKVSYRLLDPEQYHGQNVLVVGGGDSALEAATSIAELGDTKVQISYRSAAFGRAKKKNRLRVEEAVANGTLQLLLSSKVKQVTEKEVVIDVEGQIHEFVNDAIIICAGGVLPTTLLDSLGVKFNTKHGSK